MIRRFYVHNFRCLENFELPLAGRSSTLLIGNNGSGKSTISAALWILQRIARGTSLLTELLDPLDLSRGRSDVPMRFEIEVELEGRIYAYMIAIELAKKLGELRVREEKLAVDGVPIYSRESTNVRVSDSSGGEDVSIIIDFHLVALPGVPLLREGAPLSVIKQWLTRMLILRPVPSLIFGDARETLISTPDLADFAQLFWGLFNHAPSAYGKSIEYLREVMPDLKDIQNRELGRDYRGLVVQFSNDHGSLSVPLGDLSDGEKCFMIGAMVLAMNDTIGPIFCFWDEPDNYLAISEVGHFVMALRKAFQKGGQFVATSHNPEAIRCFSDENTLLLYRRSHLEPTQVRPLSEIQVNGDLIGALIRGDVEP